jgi:hypothetical protein
MKDLNAYMNFDFETYTPDRKFLNGIDRPGCLVNRLGDLNDAPDQLAIIPEISA